MTGDIENRVYRLPKPSRASEALQPLFEAVSNSIHATESKFKGNNPERGRVSVSIAGLTGPEDLHITVEDNGIGLTDKRFEAFCTTDTDFKMRQGGKGIGRLLWLDAFSRVRVQSVFRSKGAKYKRSFSFRLQKSDQISDETLEQVDLKTRSGTIIEFIGLRGTPYQQNFPVQVASIIRHFGSHFLAEFIMGSSPKVRLHIEQKSVVFPQAVRDLIAEVRDVSTITTNSFGTLTLHNFACRKGASAQFDGNHQLHYVANGRTVTTRKIDGLLGLGKFGPTKNYVYHGCITGEYLDQRVNQERTHFNFNEDTAELIAKECAENIRSNALAAETTEFDTDRLSDMNSFLSEYPSFHFEEADQLITRIPKNAVKAEQFAQALIATRIRRDQARNKQIQQIVNLLRTQKVVPEDFAQSIRDAAEQVQAEERRQLTEYVMRRKIALDVLESLISRIKEDKGQSADHFLEKTLHQFICPMQIRADDPTKVERTKHDLWIVDERMTFAKYFASDIPVSQLIIGEKSSDRPDLMIYDQIHGLGLGAEEPLSKVVLIEFKRPGREKYPERYFTKSNNRLPRYALKWRSGKLQR